MESGSAVTVMCTSGSWTSMSSFLSSARVSKFSRVRMISSFKSKSRRLVRSEPSLRMRERLSMWRTSRLRRRVSSAMVARYLSSSSLGMVPSRMPSAKPAMVVIGVFSSCETLAMNSFLSSSLRSSESAMALKELVSAASSSVPLSSRTRTEKSPWAKRRAAAVISSRGSESFLDITRLITSASESTASVTAKNTQKNASHAPIIVERSELTNT